MRDEHYLAMINKYKERERILLVGPALSGKSTQAHILAEKRGLVYVSWGKISRLLKKSDHRLSKMIEFADQHNLPHPYKEVTDFLVKDVLSMIEQSGRGWILDGYPRNLNEYESLVGSLNKSKQPITNVVIFDTDDNKLINRAKERVICPECDKSYSTKEGITKCTNDNAELIERSDDAIIKERLEWYKEDTYPVIEKLFQDRADSIIEVDASLEKSQVTAVIEEKIKLTPFIIEEDNTNGIWYNMTAEANLPTKWGEFMMSSFVNKITNENHVCMTFGDVKGKYNVPLRIHSSCVTGDIFHSKKCDCGSQLDNAMEIIAKNKSGILIYLFQEGRGIGLNNKLNAYKLQELGVDTLEANRILHLPDDARNYEAAVDMINYAGPRSIQLITNNPEKISGLMQYGINVTGVIPAVGSITQENRKYLETKRDSMGHNLPQSSSNQTMPNNHEEIIMIKNDWTAAGLPLMLLEKMNYDFNFENIVSQPKESHEAKTQQQNYEYELKFSADMQILEKVQATGNFEYDGSYIEQNFMYDDGRSLIYENDARLRLRTKKNVHTDEESGLLTFKKPLKNKSAEHGKEELELESNLDSEQLSQLQSSLATNNYVLKSSYQRIRHSFKSTDGQIKLDIDVFPDIGTFIEVEGDQEQALKIANELGFDPSQSLDDPYDTIHADWCLSQDKPEVDFISFGTNYNDIVSRERLISVNFYKQKRQP